MGSRGSKVGNTVVCFLLLAASLYLVVDAGEEGYAEASDDPAVWDDVELGENLAFDATPSGSAAMTDAPGCWNDGILTNQNGWISCTGAGGDGHWMMYEWTEPVSIWAFKIWHFYADGSRRLLAGCNDIQYWDGSKFVGVGGYNAENAGIMDGGKPYLQVCPEVVYTTKFRLYDLLGKTGTSQLSNPSISEWEIYGPLGVSDLSVNISDGYGPLENIYPAWEGDGKTEHWINARVYAESGVQDLRMVEAVFTTEEPELEIKLRYNFWDGTFEKLNDRDNLILLKYEFCSYIPDAVNPEFYANVEFRYDFSLFWPTLDPVSLKVTVSGMRVAPSVVDLPNVFSVETRFEMYGNLSIVDGSERELESGEWVRAGDIIHFSGLTPIFYGLDEEIRPPATIRIGVEDQTTMRHFGEGQDLDLVMDIGEDFSQLTYKLRIDGISEEKDRSEASLKKDFLYRVDGDMPGTPGEVTIFADPEDDFPSDYDNDRSVVVSWTDAVDLSSGVARYHISLNRPRDTAREEDIIHVNKGTYTTEVSQIPEGVNKIYLWAEDAVGNHGPEIFSVVRIDLTGVIFEGFYPESGKWLNNPRPTCTIFCNDTITGVDPLSIEYVVSTEGKAGVVGEDLDWIQIQDTYLPGNSLRVVVQGWFQNGKKNFIKFRAKDLAGNDWRESDAHNVWIDSEQVRMNLLRPSQDQYQLDTTQTIEIEITDMVGTETGQSSGVDASSIEYRFTTRGTSKWTPWKPYKDAEDGEEVKVSLTLDLDRGDDNYVQVRARDLAGNSLRLSPEYNIKINTYPIPVVTSPTDDRVWFDNETITFDARESTDPDGQGAMDFTWKINPVPEKFDNEEFGQGGLVLIKNLEAGSYTITLEITDSANNLVRYSFELNVEKHEKEEEIADTDGDLVLDWYEIKYDRMGDGTKGLDYETKDADEDPDGDGFTNLQEYNNRTDPTNPKSKPVSLGGGEEEESMNFFDSSMWPLWVILIALILAILITMMVVKSRKDKAESRIRSVRNVKRIMPSVSWEQITSTAQLAPLAQGGLPMPQDMSTALPAAQGVDISQDRALPPAAEQQEEMPPQPAPQTQAPPAQPLTPTSPEPSPAPAPAPQQPQPQIGQVPQAYQPPPSTANLPSPEQGQ